MNWLNIHIPSVIRSPEFIGSSPSERGTWLCVIAYACELECGGRIAGAAHWKDRQWQQACGVTLREVSAASRLLRFDGPDLIVNGYPTEKQAVVQKARVNALAGAMARWSKRDAECDADRHSAGMPTGTKEAIAVANAEGEGERKEKGKEEEGQNALLSLEGGSASPPPSGTPRKARSPKLPDEAWLASLAADPAFAGIDVQREAAKCSRWCVEKRKTFSRQRLLNWLNRCDPAIAGTNGGSKWL